ncbi:DUF2087 domain-containing protein [Halovulum sp. GXIMD14793]
MTRHSLPLRIDDLSAFAKSLNRQLRGGATPPGHQSLLNMLARAAGYRNYQHLAASTAAEHRLARPAATSGPVDYHLVERTLNQFDANGRLTRWPSRRAVQDLALWAVWARLPSAEVLTEKQVNACLKALHDFSDPAILRRSLVTLGLVSRKKDGSDYRRIEQSPPPSARALIARLAERSG